VTTREKIATQKDLALRAGILRRKGRRIVFTNGCFDLLHAGHVRYLEAARALGDLLVLGVNSDASVRRLKGSRRPLTPQRQRLEVLAALECVSILCLFGDDTPLRLIKLIRPHVLVKGGDWPVEKIVGRDFVEASGGTVRSIPLLKGVSTTALMERIRDAGASY